MFKNYANKDSPTPGESWESLSPEERLEKINDFKKNNFEKINISRMTDNGQIFVIISENVNVSERGTLLLDFEDLLQKNIDPGLYIWCEPLGDKSSLRNLRGIEIKK